MRRIGPISGCLLATAAAASAASAEPKELVQVSGTVVDVQRSDDDVTIVLLVGEEDELTLTVGPDTRVSVDGELVATEDLDDALGAAAKVRYRETEVGLLLETIDLSWPDDAGAEVAREAVPPAG